MNSLENANISSPLRGNQKVLVILLHGIRTAAWWQNRVASIIETETAATVVPLKYGYFDLLKFLCPFRSCRRAPIERLRKQIEGIREQYKDYKLIVFAHSFGTYALSRILFENPYFTFDRIILCGSIIADSYDWTRVQNQIVPSKKRDAIINECGIRDVWPVAAKSLTFGYGATGTYGFGDYNVRDRFHSIKHSDFFEPAFIRKYWVSAVSKEAIDFSETDSEGSGTPAWFGIFRIPLRWAFVLAFVSAGAAPFLFDATQLIPHTSPSTVESKAEPPEVPKPPEVKWAALPPGTRIANNTTKPVVTFVDSSTSSANSYNLDAGQVIPPSGSDAQILSADIAGEKWLRVQMRDRIVHIPESTVKVRLPQ
jgi:hypothetical protein